MVWSMSDEESAIWRNLRSLRRASQRRPSCLNTFAITTKTARILDSGREHRTVEVTLWPLLRSFLMNGWGGCITATIGLPEPSAFFGSRAFELPQKHSVDPFMGCGYRGSIRSGRLSGSIRVSYPNHCNGESSHFRRG